MTFHNYAWNKDKEIYNLLTGRFEFSPFDFKENKFLLLFQRLKELNRYLDSLKRSREFQKFINRPKILRILPKAMAKKLSENG